MSIDETYDRRDARRVLEEEHHALRTVGRWLRELLLQNARGVLDAPRVRTLTAFLDDFRGELVVHFEREEARTERFLTETRAVAEDWAWIQEDHARILAEMDALRQRFAVAVQASRMPRIEHLTDFLLLLERHERREQETIAEVWLSHERRRRPNP